MAHAILRKVCNLAQSLLSGAPPMALIGIDAGAPIHLSNEWNTGIPIARALIAAPLPQVTTHAALARSLSIGAHAPELPGCGLMRALMPLRSSMRNVMCGQS